MLFLFSNLELLSSTNTAIKHFERSVETQKRDKNKGISAASINRLAGFQVPGFRKRWKL